MVNKEFHLLPEEPKSLKRMDPTKFRPTWNKSGRRSRLTMASKTYEEVESAFYEKGIARVSILAAVDDTRKVLVHCHHYHHCHHCHLFHYCHHCVDFDFANFEISR